MTRFSFAFEPAYRAVGRAFGVSPSSAWVEVNDDRFEARFGPWRVRTPITNIASAAVSGPYSVPKTIGPARLSFRDLGVTFATTSEQGVCVTFRRPVRGIDPAGIVRHPGLTVTVSDPAALVEALEVRA